MVRFVVRFACTAWLALAGLAVTASAEDAYRLGEGDQVRLFVFQREDLSIETRLGENGRFFVPMSGKIDLSGMTIAEAEKEISGRLARSGAMPNPQIDLQVIQFGAQKVSVFGYVFRPGAVVLDRPTRLTELLALTGGISPDGSDEVILLRGTERRVIDVKRIVEDGVREGDVAIRGGDIVTVPRAPRIYVYGAVNSGGPIKLEKGMTSLEIISLAGGLAPTGSDNRLEVVRRQADGSTKSIKVNLQDVLMPEDVLIVRESIF